MDNFSLKQNISLKAKQKQHLYLSDSMQQAFRVLMLPTIELSEWLKLEIEQNPALEFQENPSFQEAPAPEFDEMKDLNFDQMGFEILSSLDESFIKGVFSEGHEFSQSHIEKQKKMLGQDSLSATCSLFEHLMNQARVCFHTEQELDLAQILIGNLDEKGFLPFSLENLIEESTRPIAKQILAKIQTFDPPGIAAHTIQESFLMQLEFQEKSHTLAYRMIKDHYEDLIHNRLSLLQKKCKCSLKALKEAIVKDISRLDIHPGERFHSHPVSLAIPDVIIKKEEEKWTIDINEEALPRFRISSHFQRCFEQTPANDPHQSFFRKHLSSGKWLLHIVQKRNQTLKEIARCLTIKQREFFSGNLPNPVPMEVKEIAEMLSLHESTIHRAIANKYLFSPRGCFTFRHFFTPTQVNEKGEKISNQTIKELLAMMIRQEDKTSPLSDQALSHQIQQRGFPCARRTVAKYRKSLKILSASQRRKWH